MPVRVRLAGGALYVVGIGSRMRFGLHWAELDGVSLEVVRAGAKPQVIAAAGLEVIGSAADAHFSVFTDKADLLTVFTRRGEALVRAAGGELLDRVGAGEAMSFARASGFKGVRTQANRAPLEMARILMRQLQHLRIVEQERPIVRSTLNRMRSELVEGSGGLLGDASEAVPGFPVVDPARLLEAVQSVEDEMNHSRLGLAGCGNPRCAPPAPPVGRKTFDGVVGILPRPSPGCTLCRESAGRSETAR